MDSMISTKAGFGSDIIF